MWSTITSGKVWKGEIQNKAKDGKFYWVDTTIIPFLDAQGKPYQYLSIRSDITSKKKTQALLDEERARSAHSEKMATLGIMASGIAHELGNPLAALRGRIEMLQVDAENKRTTHEKTYDVTVRLLHLTDRINKIIRGLKAYARDGSQDPYDWTSISSLILDLLELVQNKCTKLNVKVMTEGLDKDLQIQCRETEIGQVLVNLMNNSLDAIRNLDEKWIKIILQDLGEVIKISIVDSGKGIDQKTAKNIFNPFYTTKPVGQGTGLGLSISTTLIESHSGKLELNSNCSNTCFDIILPKKHNNLGEPK